MHSDAPTRRGTYTWGLVTVCGVIAGYLAVLFADVRHFYTDDTESQYAPLWVMLGRELRAGRFPMMVPEHWMGGNYTIEEAGLLNPPQLLIDLIAPSVDDLAVYATVVKLVFAVILGLGVFRVCKEYGAALPWAAVAGVAFPFSGWLLFFDQSTWYTAFTGTAWLVQAWASAVRYTRGKSGPVPTFVFLYLAISVQYVFPAVEAGIVIAAVAVGEWIHQRRGLPSLRLIAVAACAGAAGAATYLPSAFSAMVTWRGTAQINNDQFLTVPWSESLNASLPSALPAYNSWWGYIQPMPVTYIAWFLVPALAFVDWRRARENWREFVTAALVAVTALMWTAGPGTIGPLRWPARVLPLLALGLLVLVCVLLGRYATTRELKQRSVVAGVLLGVLLLRTVSAAPDDFGWHLLSVAAIAVLGAVVLRVDLRRGAAAACAVVIASIVPIAYLQVRAAQPTPLGWDLPERRSEMKVAFPEFPGTTLQLADRALILPQERTLDGAYGSLVFGNYAKNLELTYVSGYTPNGHLRFGDLLCMRWDTSVCPDAFRRAFATEPTTGATVVDLMKVDRVVVQRALFPDVVNQPAPEGWTWVEYPGHERHIAVLERRDGPRSTRDGRIAVTSGVTARSTRESDRVSGLRVDSAEGGRIVFARLNWPGYRARLDGRELPVTDVGDVFVAVDIPAGTSDGDLELTWTPPGQRLGAAAAAVGVAGVVMLEWAYRRNRRREIEPQDDICAPSENTAEVAR